MGKNKETENTENTEMLDAENQAPTTDVPKKARATRTTALVLTEVQAEGSVDELIHDSINENTSRYSRVIDGVKYTISITKNSVGAGKTTCTKIDAVIAIDAFAKTFLTPNSPIMDVSTASYELFRQNTEYPSYATINKVLPRQYKIRVMAAIKAAISKAE